MAKKSQSTTAPANPPATEAATEVAANTEHAIADTAVATAEPVRVIPAKPHHELAKIFPMMEGKEFADLKKDIETNGQQSAIWLHQGFVIDGRNRERACIELGVDPVYADYEGDDPLAFVMSANLFRRHLTPTQRAWAANDLTNVEHGGARRGDAVSSEGKLAEVEGGKVAVSRERAAAVSNVSPKMLQHSATIKQKGIQELKDIMPSGTIPATIGARIAELSPDHQREILEADKDKRPVLLKEFERQRKMDAVAEVTKVAATKAGQDMYQIFLIDPPWSRLDRNDDYTLEDLGALKLPMAPNSVVYLWTTNKFLAYGISLLARWGISYRDNFVWNCGETTNGDWNRQNHQVLLVGTHGSPAVAGSQWDSCFDETLANDAPKGTKPDYIYDMIEAQFPGLPRLEVFSTVKADAEDWDSWSQQEVDAALRQHKANVAAEQTASDKAAAEDLAEEAAAEAEENAEAAC